MHVPTRQKNGPWAGWMAAALTVAIVYWLTNALFGPLNQDEGWYLLAAQNTALHGMLPYRDYLYTQGPVQPFVYALLYPLWGWLGVLGGRFLTALLGALAVLLAADTARVSAGRLQPGSGAAAFFVTFTVTALLPDYSYFTVLPKTYALSALLLCAGFRLLAAERPRAFWAGLCFAAAFGTRASLCVAAAAAWVPFAVADVRALCASGGAVCGFFRLPSVRFALGCLVFLVPVYGWLFATEGARFWFSQTYHTARAGEGFFAWLLLRAGFVSYALQGTFPLWVALLSLPFWPGRPRLRTLPPAILGAGLAFLALTLTHLLAPFPYNDYNTPAWPLAGLAAGCMLGAAWTRAGLAARPALPVLALSCLFAVASPLCLQWVGGRQHLFWFETDARPQILALREAGRWVREHLPEAEPLVTQDAYLAVEARRRVLPGLEMGPFSLFPELSDEEARFYRVHNVATLAEALASAESRVAAVSGYTFAIACPSTRPLDAADAARLQAALEARFGAEPARVMASFGQQRTTLRLFLR